MEPVKPSPWMRPDAAIAGIDAARIIAWRMGGHPTSRAERALRTAYSEHYDGLISGDADHAKALLAAVDEFEKSITRRKRIVVFAAIAAWAVVTAGAILIAGFVSGSAIGLVGVFLGAVAWMFSKARSL